MTTAGSFSEYESDYSDDSSVDSDTSSLDSDSSPDISNSSPDDSDASPDDSDASPDDSNSSPDVSEVIDSSSSDSGHNEGGSDGNDSAQQLQVRDGRRLKELPGIEGYWIMD